MLTLRASQGPGRMKWRMTLLGQLYLLSHRGKHNPGLRGSLGKKPYKAGGLVRLCPGAKLQSSSFVNGVLEETPG